MTTTVTVYGQRAADFTEVFGTATVPVVSWLPARALLPGFSKPQQVYLLDLGWARQQGHWPALVAFLAARFGQDPREVDAALEAEGMPILADDCVVSFDSRDFL